MKKDEFKMRYIIKLGSSVFLVALNGLVQIILPRAFTVEEYGFYTYNLNVFMSVVVMAEMAVSGALVSKFAKRNEEIGLVFFYLKFFLFMALFLNLSVIGLYAGGFLQRTFAGQTLFVVLLGLEAAIVLQLQTDSIGIFDAVAVSRFPALMQVILKVTLSAVVLISFLFNKLNLAFFYTVQIFLTFLITFSMLYELIKDAERKRTKAACIDRGSRAYAKEFWAFCKPLVVSNITSAVLVIMMNWALMNWAGAAEQAMFGAAWQINTLISYVFAPYAELSKREFAVSCNDMEALRHRVVQSLKLMMWATSYFAIFIGFTSGWLLPVLYGDKYAGAAMVTLLIMFYTVYQAWGQVEGAFWLATERTKINAAIGIAGQLMTLGLVFVFQIPNFIWPSGLGATGIALTYLVSNVIGVNAALYVNSRILRMNFWRNFSIQIIPVLLCSITTVLLKQGLDFLWIGSSIPALVGKILIAGAAYTAVVGAVAWRRPDLFGITKESLMFFKRKEGV